MKLRTLVVICAVLSTLELKVHAKEQDRVKKSEDLETQASVLGYGNYGGLNDVYDGGIYGRYPGYYTGVGSALRGYYGVLGGLGTTGLGYSNLGYGSFGYNGLGLPGIYSGYDGYGNLRNYDGYYSRAGLYR